MDLAAAACSATTSYSALYLCYNAYDGDMDTMWASNGEGNAGRITITFTSPWYISCIVAYRRCFHGDQTNRLAAEFDDGQIFEIVSVH